jgi:voltage-dependent calcium channel L type alpha-1D
MPEDEVFDEEQKEEGEASPGRRKSRGRRKSEKKKGCLDINKPEWFVNMSNKVEEFCESKFFERFIIVLILINTLFLASEYYEMPEWLENINEIANLFFTVIFALEMILKLIGFGCKKYSSDGFNLFDCFIVIMSYVELLMPGEGSGLSVLRAFRLLRIFKIIKSWDSLRILLSTVLDSLTAITNLGVLIILFLFISALLTKQFYADELGDPEEVRYSFASTGRALISVFIILTGENWNEIMVLVIN